MARKGSGTVCRRWSGPECESRRRFSIEDVDRRIGRRLGLLRRLKGIERREFARRLGLAQEELEKIENGAAASSAGLFLAAARVLGMPVAVLFVAVESPAAAAVDDAGAGAARVPRNRRRPHSASHDPDDEAAWPRLPSSRPAPDGEGWLSSTGWEDATDHWLARRLRRLPCELRRLMVETALEFAMDDDDR